MRRLSVLALVVLATGCGGGDSGTLSRPDYTKQANASCVAAERKLDALGGFDDFTELEREMKAGQDALEQAAGELRELKPPEQLVARHNQLVDVTQETADLAGRLSVAAGKNDQVAMQKEAERADELTKAANQLSHQLGLEECVAG